MENPAGGWVHQNCAPSTGGMAACHFLKTLVCPDPGWKMVQAVIRRQLFRQPPTSVCLPQRFGKQNHTVPPPSGWCLQTNGHEVLACVVLAATKDQYSAFFVTVEKRRENGFYRNRSRGHVHTVDNQDRSKRDMGLPPRWKTPRTSPRKWGGARHLGTEKGSSWSQQTGNGRTPARPAKQMWPGG